MDQLGAEVALHAILVGVVGQLADWREARRPIGRSTALGTAPASSRARSLSALSSLPVSLAHRLPVLKLPGAMCPALA
jgi:hypothetical protein